MMKRSSMGRQKERAMSKLKKVDDHEGEDGTRPLLRPAQQSAAAAILAAREEADRGVGNAIVSLRRADYDRRANML